MTRFSRQLGRGLGATAALLALGTIAPMTASAATCTSTIRGAHSGVISVAADQHVCLRGAVQNGAIVVAANGGLSVRSSTITGAVTLKTGYKELEFCGSRTIRGAISATGGRGPVLIGATGLLGAFTCPANNVDGAITLNANRAGVKLARTYVSGAVTASANLVATTISGNTIGGALTCSDNVPAPTNAGVRNVVGGGRSGQTCAPLTF